MAFSRCFQATQHCLAVAFLATLLVPSGKAQLANSPITCSFGNINPTTVRAQGIAELVADITLSCTGGSGSVPISGDFTLNLNTQVTSRLLDANGTSEALLLVNADTTQAPVIGSNAFRGVISAANQLSFSHVSFVPPGTGAVALRITNVRANAAGLGLGTSFGPTQILAFVQTNSNASISVSTSAPTVALNSEGLVFGTLGSSTAQVGVSQTAFSLQATEGFGTAFKMLSIPNQDPGTPGQNNLNSENGYINSAQLGPSTGFATQATRLTAVFTGIPNGATLYAGVQARGVSNNGTAPAAVLVSADANGNGGSVITGQPLFGGQYQPLSVTTPTGGLPGFATATWEVTAASATVDTLAFDVVVNGAHYAVDAANHLIGPIQAQLFLSPQNHNISASATAPVPRFGGAPDLLHPTNLSLTTLVTNSQGQNVNSNTTLAQGTSLTFTHTIVASGGDAPSATLVQIYLASLQVVSCSAPGGTCSISQGSILASFPVLRNGQTAGVVVTGQVPAGAAAGTYTASTTVSTSGWDLLPADNSTTFAYTLNTPPTCSYQISPATARFSNAPSSGTVSVTTDTNCSWSATVDSLSWLVLQGATYGTGNGQVNYFVAPNSNASPRTGTLTIAGQSFIVTQAGTGAHTVASDFNNDGFPDLVWQNDTTRQVTVNYYSGATYQSYAFLNQVGAPGWRVVAVADFNKDGAPDLIWQNDVTRQVTVNYYGGASFQSYAHLNQAGAPGWRVVAVADFNGDGAPDLVWQNDTTRQVTVNYYSGATGSTFLGWSFLNQAGALGWSLANSASPGF